MVNCDDGPLMLAKLLIALAMAMVPIAPPGSYDFIWGSKAIFIQSAYIIILAIACYVDVTLGLLFSALVVAISIQKRYVRN